MYRSEISTRFSRGMSTPAIRAIRYLLLALALPVPADGTNHEDGPLPPNNLALLAAPLDRCPYFHANRLLLRPHPTRDPPTLQVVWRQLHEHLGPRDHPNEVHPHLPRDVGQHVVAVLELDLEHRVGEGLTDHALHLDDVLTGGHKLQTQKVACPPKRSRELKMYQKRASTASPGPSGSLVRRGAPRRCARSVPTGCRPR